jgi:hypothetical protein
MNVRDDIMEENHRPCQQNKVSFYFKSFSQPDYNLTSNI